MEHYLKYTTKNNCKYQSNKSNGQGDEIVKFLAQMNKLCC